jgi:hypothetical protein
MVIIDEDLIKAAKIAASRTDGMFQGSSRSCWTPVDALTLRFHLKTVTGWYGLVGSQKRVLGGVAGGPEDAKMNPSIEQSGSLLFSR